MNKWYEFLDRLSVWRWRLNFWWYIRIGGLLDRKDKK